MENMREESVERVMKTPGDLYPPFHFTKLSLLHFIFTAHTGGNMLTYSRHSVSQQLICSFVWALKSVNKTWKMRLTYCWMACEL